jgi:hypothetical protein
MNIELLTDIVFLGVMIGMIILIIVMIACGCSSTRTYYRIKFDAFKDKDCTAIIKAKNIVQAEIKFYKRYKCECRITSIEVMK